MQLSVIIPARNEELHIGPVLERACGRHGREIIVVDGDSEDRTADVARRHGASVIHCAPGRGTQMNAGAAAAAGETLLFLHADTLPPFDLEEHIARALDHSDVVAGAFRLCIDAPHRGLRVVERLVAWRCRWLQTPYGDQGLFLPAATFRRLGGFRDWPVMEDYELVRRLRRQGRIAVSPAPIVTCGRRWLAGGICRTTIRNQICIAALRLGISPARIARWRGVSRDRPPPPRESKALAP